MNFNLSIDLAPLVNALSGANIELAQRVSVVVAATAQSAYERWADAVMKANGVWVGEKSDYVGSIKVRSINGFEAEVWSDYKHAKEIETGRPQRDLKRMLDTSVKVRVSAKGARYLIIPMRHNTPGSNALSNSMPPNVYAGAKMLSPSSVIGTVTRLSGLNAYNTKTKLPMVTEQNIYKWGGRLPAGLSAKLKSEHKTDPYAGMVRMKQQGGGSAYLTFRTMTENSHGWIVPEKPGMHIVQNVVNDVRPLFEQAMAEAIKGILPA
jgi:hypothetical protein